MEFAKIEGSDGEKQLGSNGWLHMSLLPGDNATEVPTKMRVRNAFKPFKTSKAKEQWLYCLVDSVYVYLFEREDIPLLSVTHRDFYPKVDESRAIDPTSDYKGLLTALGGVRVYMVVQQRNIHLVVTCLELPIDE